MNLPKKIQCIECDRKVEPVRKGRADYHCPECNTDMTMLLVLLEEALNK